MKKSVRLVRTQADSLRRATERGLSGFLFFAFVVIFLVAAPSWALDGDLDTSFGTGGKVTTAIGSGNDSARALGIQSDGKIVAAGSSSNGSNTDFAVIRYNTDGTLDTSFGTGGKVTTAIGSSYEQAYALAIQSDGKIVAAGSSSNGSDYDFAVVRYNTDGTVDMTFGTGGKITTDVGGYFDEALALAIQSDGKIVAAGYSSNGSNNDFALVRYNTDGSVDTTFGTGGKVTTNFGGYDDSAIALGIQSDGKIVAAGVCYGFVSGNNDFAVVRYNTDGSLDTSFGTGGIVATFIGSYNDIARALGIQSDGKIVAAGYSNNGSNPDFALVRYNTDGTLDTTFGTGGKVTTAIGSSYEEAYALGIQSDGKIVAAGYSQNGGYVDFAVVRYNTDGTVDTTFGGGGKITTAIGSYNDIAYTLGIQSDGKIVVAGYSHNGSNEDFAVARYLGTDNGTGTRNASGTGVWDSGTGTLTLDTTISDFICDGLVVGTEIIPGVTITTDTMTWPEDTWTRSPAGAANDPVGVWTMTDSYTGNAYTLIINSNGTFSLEGIIIACGSESGEENPRAWSNHWSSGYYVPLSYQDPGQSATAVSVTGPGITGSLSLAYDTNWGGWNSWILENTPFLGTTSPAGLPYTYTFTITDGTGTWTADSIVSYVVEPFATGLAPTGTVSVNPAFAWAEVSGNYTYGVELHDNSGATIWSVYDLTTPAVAYPGSPALTEGMTYNYNIVVSDVYGNASFAEASFTYQTAPTPLYVAWQDDTLTPGNMDIFMKKSTDNGVTWTWQQISNNAGNSQLPMIAVDNTNAVYVVWQDDTLGNNDIFMKKSTDNGVTWTWQQISNNAGNSQLPMIAVDNTNAVYVAWQDNTLGNNDIFMKKSTDNGVTWTWQQISNNAGNSLSPKIAVDNTNAVYVVWQDDTLTPGNMDIFMKKSTDNGLTWVWQQISNNAGNSQSPMLAVDNTNAVYVAWQDNTLGNNDIFMKKSTDNGVTWVWQQISNNAGNSIMPAMVR